MKAPGALRSSEWFLIVYFSYVALISSRFPLQSQGAWRPFGVAVLVAALIAALAYGEAWEHRTFFSIARDWLAVALVLVAYREMDWFSVIAHDHHLELRWIEWDRGSSTAPDCSAPSSRWGCCWRDTWNSATCWCTRWGHSLWRRSTSNAGATW